MIELYTKFDLNRTIRGEIIDYLSNFRRRLTHWPW